MAKFALDVTQEENFSAWYQAAVRGADLAEESGVRGAMIIKPWGMGIWERIRSELGQRIRETGHEDHYFPLLIPLHHFEAEAQHVAGFAKEMAVVTHYRLSVQDGKLRPDPEAALEEPLIIRPTSETIIGSAMSKWVKSYRDLPLLINQWANVMRWEMRTRMFLRTSEFLWQEGHTAHATADEAMDETRLMLDVYRDLANTVLSLHVMHGPKPAHDRFPGALETLAIEAMMRDGRALQSGTSHYLGTNFAKAQDIRYQTETGAWEYASTTSWGVSTRIIGALVMAHGDNDGLRLPPAVAPHQVVIVPMFRGADDEGLVRSYCRDLAADLRSRSTLGAPIRAFVDTSRDKPVNRRWDWIRKGVPLICEVGARDVAAGTVSFYLRNGLRTEEGKLDLRSMPRDQFVLEVSHECETMQTRLLAESRAFTESNVAVFDGDQESFIRFVDANPGKWFDLGWNCPTGEALDSVLELLARKHLTVRLVQAASSDRQRVCIATGEPARASALVARAY